VATTVFLSDSHGDLEQARRLFTTLSSVHGLDVWFDKESLVAGQKWEVAIRQPHRTRVRCGSRRTTLSSWASIAPTTS
jgi:hypothetical protein